MTQVIWDPDFWPDDDLDDVKLIKQFQASYVPTNREVELIANNIIETTYSSRITLRGFKKFTINNENWGKVLSSCGKSDNNSDRYIVYISYNLNKIWYHSIGSFIFGKYNPNNIKEWENLLIDFDLGKDIKDLIKYAKY